MSQLDGQIECEVIIPVYNALTQTARCIESVLKCSTTHNYRFILVNDCSDEPTAQHLRAVAAEHPHVVLLENEQNLGFLHTANRGLLYSVGKDNPRFKLLLNSDTVVASGWLEAFDRCFASDPTIGIATPLSNNAENLSIKIPEGMDLHSLSSMLKELDSKDKYPDIATAIGFCMAIKSELVTTVGVFDEVFAPGYAEDSDYHFRALCGAYRSVLVSDCFIYHESHASFSEKKQMLVDRNRPIFDQRWRIIYRNELDHHQTTNPVESIGRKVQEQVAISARNVHYDILFILPTAKLFGGIIVAFELINRLILNGWRANAIVIGEEQPISMDLLFTPLWRPEAEWPENIPQSRTYVATHFETCAFAAMAKIKWPAAKTTYLVQGYESWFPGATIAQVVRTYKAIANRITVSKWLQDQLGKWGYSSTKIPNGVDTKFFYPLKFKQLGKGNKGAERPTLLAFLRDDPQGGWKISFQVIKELHKRIPNLKVIAIGSLANSPEIVDCCDVCYEHVGRKQMANIYREANVFIDCSMVQGFGLMGLEAMASGVATVLTMSGGVLEYANNSNSILCQLGDANAIIQGVEKLLSDDELRARIVIAGRKTALEFDWSATVQQYENYFQNHLKNGAEEQPSVDAEELAGMVEYLFVAQLQGKQNQNCAKSAYEALSGELFSAQGSLRGALEVLPQKLSYEALENVKTTFEGSVAISLYEAARLAVAREGAATAANNNLSHRGTILDAVKTILSSQ